jgi:hypothetical protein
MTSQIGSLMANGSNEQLTGIRDVLSLWQCLISSIPSTNRPGNNRPGGRNNQGRRNGDKEDSAEGEES